MLRTFTTVFVVLFVLKLTNQLDWSWAWVTAPVWGGLAVALVSYVGLMLLGAIVRGR